MARDTDARLMVEEAEEAIVEEEEEDDEVDDDDDDIMRSFNAFSFTFSVVEAEKDELEE